MKPRGILIAGASLVAGLGLFGSACRYKVQQFKDEHVTAGEMRSPLRSMFVHLPEDHYLAVGARTFKHVRGAAPYYLSLPRQDEILFVTGAVDRACPKSAVFVSGISNAEECNSYPDANARFGGSGA